MPGVIYWITSVNQRQLNFADKTARKLLTIVNDSSFHYRVKNANYSGRKFRVDEPRVRYIQASNGTILNQILTGKEWGVAPNGIIDLKLTLGPTRGNSIGYVKPPNPLITTKPLYFNKCMNNNDPISLAAHWMHEWLHVSGFRHKSTIPDRNDVNYKVGRLVVEIGRQHAIIDEEPESYINTLGEEYFNTYLEHADTIDEDYDLPDGNFQF